MVEFKDISQPLADIGSHYHFHKSPPMLEKLLNFVASLVRAFHEFWRNLFGHHGQSLDSRSISHFFQFVIIAVGITAVLFIIVMMVRRLSTQRKTTAKTIRGASAVEEILDSSGWKQHASKLAKQGDHRGACRAIYLSLLQKLDENGIAQFAPTKTNYEYAYLLSKHPDIQQRFKRLSGLVEVIWFGNKTADEADYNEAVQELDEVSARITGVGAS